MKKILSLVAFSFLVLTLQAQEVPEVQKSLITKITATWCPNCGTWGWTFFEDVIDENIDNAIFVGAHHSGNLESNAGSDFSANFQAPYQPYFYLGNQDLDVSSGNVAAKITETTGLVQAQAMEMPIVNVGFTATIDGLDLTINSKTKFFQEAEGDFYLGLYVLEDGVINNQQSNSSMASHPYVLRTAFTAETFGETLSSGTVSAGTEFDNSHTITLASTWIVDNISVIGVIWDKNDNTYEFVNVNAIDEFSTTAVNVITEDKATITLSPTLATDLVQLTIDQKETSLNLSIALFNQNGQLLRSIFQGVNTQGSQTWDIATNDLAAGTYLVRVQAADGALVTKQFIVQ